MEVAGAGAQPDCAPDGLVPGTVAGEGTGEYPFNGIQSHPADRGTGGGCGGVGWGGDGAVRWDAAAPTNGADMKEVAGWKRKEKMVQLLPVSTAIWWVQGSHQYGWTTIWQ